MARRAAAGLVVLALLLGGCWDRTEIDDTAYVVSMGVDVTADGEAVPFTEYLWTFRIVEAEQLPVGMLSPATMQRPGQLAAGVISVRAASLEQALQLLQAGSARVVSLAQMRYVVVSQQLARRGLGPLLRQLLRHPQVRQTAGLSVAVGRAVDNFLNNRPLGDLNPAKFMEGILLVQKKMHLSPPLRLHHFNGRLLAAGVDPLLPLSAVNPLASESPGSQLPPMGGRSLLAGEFPRAGGNPLELAGSAAFRGDRLVGLLSVDETSALLSLRGEMGKVYASVPDPREPEKVITLRVHQENKPQYRAAFAAGRPAVTVRLQLEGEVLSVPGGTSWAEPERRRELERHVAGQLQRTVYGPLVRKVFGEWGADPVGFGNLFRSRFPTFDAWLAYDWPEHVRDLRVTVEIELFIRRFGLLLDGGAEFQGR